jgi:soluble lytic murein transglycosylase-like protein
MDAGLAFRLMRIWNRFVVALVFVLVVALCVGVPHCARAADAVRVPEHAVLYRVKIERETAAVFGITGSPARIAAQIHQESRFEPRAASAYAQGLMQFTPATATWLADVVPECAPADPWDPDWSLRCGIRYDFWLYERAPGATPCDRWAFTLADYNGGGKGRRKEQQLARDAAADPNVWFGSVERFRWRMQSAFKENRGYVRRILTVLEHAYVDAGWPGEPVCPETGATP